jgi:hypothetical protein
MHINHTTEKATSEKVITHGNTKDYVADKKKNKFMSLLEKQQLGLEPTTTTIVKRESKPKPQTTPPAQAVVVTPEPVKPREKVRDKADIQHTPLSKVGQPIETQKQVDPDGVEGIISHAKQPVFKKESKANPTTVSHTDPEEPFVAHQTKTVKPVYTEPAKPFIDKTDPADHIVNHGVSVPRVESPSVDPTSILFLDNKFGKDIPGIVDAIIVGFDFEKFPLDFTIPNFSIIHGEDGFASATPDNPFTLRSSYSTKGLVYMMNRLLSIAYGMGYDKAKLTEMLIDMVGMAKNVNEWLIMIKDLWFELEAQAKF